MKYSLTVFTPTYNRGYILPKLKESLQRQDSFDFEWLIVDDGSTDNTEDIVSGWMKENLPFTINYHKVKNGGKPRAINYAVPLCNSEWMFWIDSDDYMVDNTIGFLISSIHEIENDASFVGIGGLRGTSSTVPFKEPLFKIKIDADSLERGMYGLDVDCNEVYRVSVLKNFPFEVWPGEIFVPEEVVLHEMALQGYKYRWYNRVIVISEYLTDGMTKGANSLIKKNPMGYAMLYNHKLKFHKGFKNRANIVCQFIAYCIIGKNPQYILKCNSLLLALTMLPIGIALSIRRSYQLRRL